MSEITPDATPQERKVLGELSRMFANRKAFGDSTATLISDITGTAAANDEGAAPGDAVENQSVAELREIFRAAKSDVTRFLLPYKFGIDTMVTKLHNLEEEFTELGEYNPIEHINSRLKSPDSIAEKVQRRGLDGGMDQVRQSLTDIAGVRVVCSFVTDVYHVFELLTQQDDITVLQVKDYIADPKPNGYRSLHLILQLPVFLSTGPVDTIVEVQLRTIAMDFWASLEHKIYYKYEREIPAELLEGLHDAAESAGELDSRMESLHIAIRGGDRDTRVRRAADSKRDSRRNRAAFSAERQGDPSQPTDTWNSEDARGRGAAE